MPDRIGSWMLEDTEEKVREIVNPRCVKKMAVHLSIGAIDF